MSADSTPAGGTAATTNDGGDRAAVDRSPAADAGTPNEPEVLLSVTKGNPTPEELAALTAVLAAVGSAQEPEEAPAALTRRERIRRAALRPRNMMNQRRGRY